MCDKLVGPLTLRAKVERWPLTVPFRITGYTWEHIDVLLVSLERDEQVGQGQVRRSGRGVEP